MDKDILDIKRRAGLLAEDDLAARRQAKQQAAYAEKEAGLDKIRDQQQHAIAKAVDLTILVAQKESEFVGGDYQDSLEEEFALMREVLDNMIEQKTAKLRR